MVFFAALSSNLLFSSPSTQASERRKKNSCSTRIIYDEWVGGWRRKIWNFEPFKTTKLECCSRFYRSRREETENKKDLNRLWCFHWQPWTGQAIHSSVGLLTAEIMTYLNRKIHISADLLSLCNEPCACQTGSQSCISIVKLLYHHRLIK